MNPADPTSPPVLWSAATAREIVVVIAEDVEAGLLSPSEAVDLIDRVRARAGRVPGGSGAGIQRGIPERVPRRWHSMQRGE